jgi:hypothetical protein
MKRSKEGKEMIVYVWCLVNFVSWNFYYDEAPLR